MDLFLLRPRRLQLSSYNIAKSISSGGGSVPRDQGAGLFGLQDAGEGLCAQPFAGACAGAGDVRDLDLAWSAAALGRVGTHALHLTFKLMDFAVVYDES